MRVLLFASTAVLILSASAFAAPPKPPPPTSKVPEKSFPTGAEFRAVEMNGRPVSREIEATLLIDTAFRGQGKAGCNNWSATLWPVRGQHFLAGGISTTRRACPAPVMAFEHAFLGILASGATWDIVRDDLVVRSPRGTLRFQRGL